jgi:hypothetical protein
VVFADLRPVYRRAVTARRSITSAARPTRTAGMCARSTTRPSLMTSSFGRSATERSSCGRSGPEAEKEAANTHKKESLLSRSKSESNEQPQSDREKLSPCKFLKTEWSLRCLEVIFLLDEKVIILGEHFEYDRVGKERCLLGGPCLCILKEANVFDVARKSCLPGFRASSERMSLAICWGGWMLGSYKETCPALEAYLYAVFSL